MIVECEAILHVRRSEVTLRLDRAGSIALGGLPGPVTLELGRTRCAGHWTGRQILVGVAPDAFDIDAECVRVKRSTPAPVPVSLAGGAP